MTGFFPLLRLQLLSRFADMKPKNLKTAFKEKRGRTVGMFIAVLILIVYMAGFLYFIGAGKKFAYDSANEGAKKPLGGWFYPLGIAYIVLAVLALILGAIYGGIG